ncbi:hypothetical protein FHG87_023831, partial [Trinorchestia longiramus]
TADLFRNQVTITNLAGQKQSLDHHFHIITDSTDDVNRWLFLQCIRKPVCHRPKTSTSLRSLSVSSVPNGQLSFLFNTPHDLNVLSGSKTPTRRSSLSVSITPSFRDSPYDGSTCYLEYVQRRLCTSSYDVERTRAYLDKVRKNFFRQKDLDFV